MFITQADPGWDLTDGTRAPLRDPKTLAETDGQPDGYQEFLMALRDQVIAFRRPVAYVHGDSHYFRVDKPFLDSQGRRLENFTRVETFGDNQANGNNDVHWLKVLVDARSRDVFTYQPQIVPGNRTAVPGAVSSSSSPWPWPWWRRDFTLKPEILSSAPWFVLPRLSLTARCWMFTNAYSPDPRKMNPVGSALVSRIDAKRTQPSVRASSSSPSGRQIQRSLPRSSDASGLRLVTDVTEPSSRTTRLPVCGWKATLSYMARSSLPVMKRSTVGMVPVGGAGTAVLGGFSTRHMISAFDAAVLDQAAVGVALAAGVGPARSEHALPRRRWDRCPCLRACSTP